MKNKNVLETGIFILEVSSYILVRKSKNNFPNVPNVPCSS